MLGCAKWWFFAILLFGGLFAVAINLPLPSMSVVDIPLTKVPSVELEAKNRDVHVYAGIGKETQQLGGLAPGTLYRVIAQQADWYLIEFLDSPSGSAWVFSDEVLVYGDPNSIPQLGYEPTPIIISATPTMQK